jgi:hypothetical protein
MVLKWGSIAVGLFVAFGLFFLMIERSLFLSEARSQETTSVTYRNPDFPCVTAINPTVTDFACVSRLTHPENSGAR